MGVFPVANDLSFEISAAVHGLPLWDDVMLYLAEVVDTANSNTSFGVPNKYPTKSIGIEVLFVRCGDTLHRFLTMDLIAR